MESTFQPKRSLRTTTSLVLSVTDYSFFYKRRVDAGRISRELPRFDVFISAYNSSERVQTVFNDVRAQKKYWLIHPEYQFTPIEYPAGGDIVVPGVVDEVTQVESLLRAVGTITTKNVCVDVTGFMRHVIVFLLAKLQYIGVTSFTALYSEPISYIGQEHTAFSTTTSGAVRPVRGMAASSAARGRDYLIVGVGYDHRLIGEVANHKDNASVYPLFVFPSLSPDMYQQSAVRAADSGEIALQDEWISNRRFAPGNDPFATATVVHEIVDEIDRRRSSANVYLAPLATKAQVLGFGLFWVLDGRQRGNITMLQPECLTYSRETSVGLNRLWSYVVELA